MKKGREMTQKEDFNVINMKDFKDGLINAATGGSGIDENWLGNLVPGTCFLSRAKNDKGPELLEQHVIHQTGTTTLLVVRQPDSNTLHRHVDSLRFSRSHECVKVLGVTLPTEEKEETDNGNSNPV